jgi:hypothetical protein
VNCPRTSPTNLKYMRLFYLAYPNLLGANIGHAMRDELAPAGHLNPNLSWTHDRLLTKVESSDARSFYEIEAAKERLVLARVGAASQ